MKIQALSVKAIEPCTSKTMTRRLHIGGTTACEGWEILNAIPEAWVDHIGQAEDLSRFEGNIFDEIYASHVLEHLGYQSALPAALREWYRVLKPEGRLMVSVPDLDTLCQLYSQRTELRPEDRFAVMRMMFGGQLDEFDFHFVGLNEEFLASFLSDAGFANIKRVSEFGLFADCSTLIFAGRPISLNIEAYKVTAGSGSPSPLPTTTLPNRTQARISPPPAGDLLQASTSWGGGYYTGLTYGCYSFVELAPNWLDFALLSQRHRPPRSGGEGSPFHYLELGSGMGLNLCLLAAAYPEATFVGIDFHPSHIAHSQWLASELGVSNVSFHEADFLELAAADAQMPFDAGLGFHYAVAHGILSWVGAEVRTAMLQLVGRLLRPGGAFYCSYNTYPGWLGRSAFKALADLERQRLGAANLPLALEKAGASLARLLENASPLRQAMPQLAVQLQRINQNANFDYLCGEFPEHWQPFYVGQVHQLTAGHKLSYACSASLPDNFPTLLPAKLPELLAAEADPTIRQALQDLAINQGFRRDVFVKGPLPLSRTAQEQQLSQLLLRATGEPRGDAGQPIRIDTNLGVMVDESGRLQQLEAQLSRHPARLAELHEAMGIPPEELVMLTSLLLHAGRVGLDRGGAGAAARASCQAVNARLIRLMQGGHNLGYLAAPAIGHGAQPFSLVDAFVLEALEQGLDEDILSSCVLMGLQATGVELRGADGTLLTDSEQTMRQIKSEINRFRDQTLHRLVKLGIVDQPT
jgi:predicted SAM-dependent methyltransferase